MEERVVNKKLQDRKRKPGAVKGRPPVKSLRIEKDIRDRLARGEWNEGDLLPTEADLTVHYGVSRMTLRLALSFLEQEGLLIRKRGKGTFAGAVGSSNRAPVAVILNDSQIEDEHSYHDQLNRGIRMGLGKKQVPLIPYHIPVEEGRLMALIEEDPRGAGRWGGVLTLPQHMDEQAREWLRERGIPLVYLSEPPEGKPESHVELDNETGGAMAMDYLLRTGRTRPLVIDNSSFWGRSRVRGIRRILREKGLEREDRFFLVNDDIHRRPSQETAAKLVAPFLKEGSIDSIVVYMEHPTIGVYRALEEAGLTPGGEIGVLHVNDYPWLCQVLDPQPSALRQPFDVVGREAAGLLLELMESDKRAVRCRRVKPHLIIRET